MTHPSDQAVSPSSDGLEVQLVCVARGYLTAALDSLPRTSNAALEVCAAWSELEQPGQLPDVSGVERPDDPNVALRRARALLRDAARAAATGAQAMSFARAVRHLDDALDLADAGPRTGEA